MKYYQWTIGGTTVRNPDRLRDGLMLLKDNFANKEWNLDQQEIFFDILRSSGIYEMGDEKYRSMTKARKQEHTRKWISILNQLGFCFAYESSGKKVIITGAGEALINHPEIEQEIFLRQLLKYQKPCALPKQNGDSFSDVAILPFIASLKMVYELGGLSKEEISVYLNSTVRIGDIDNIISQIKSYRTKRKTIIGRVKQKEFYYGTQLARLRDVFREEIDERFGKISALIKECKKSQKYLISKNGGRLLADITRGGKGSNTKKAVRTQALLRGAIITKQSLSTIRNIFLDYYLPLKMATLKDYADLTVRYLRKSGLFSINRDRLVVISEKESLIKELLSRSWPLTADKEYLDYLWSDSLPTLPTDKSDYLTNQIEMLSQKEKQYIHKLGPKSLTDLIQVEITPSANIIELKGRAKNLEQNVLQLKEIEFYYSQSQDDQIDDILNYYDLILGRQILGGEAYYPAYLEWNTWRVFLSINTLLNKPYHARRFKVDEELQPINHAPGNGADMVFEYDKFIIVTEVTLITRSNQWSAEAEPVPRHVAKVKYDNSGKDVYGVFIAPEIDANTVLQFFNNRVHSISGNIIKLVIIPFTINQIKYLLSVFKVKRYSVKDLQVLLEAIKMEMEATKDALLWNKRIPAILRTWAEAL